MDGLVFGDGWLLVALTSDSGDYRVEIRAGELLAFSDVGVNCVAASDDDQMPLDRDCLEVHNSQGSPNDSV